MRSSLHNVQRVVKTACLKAGVSTLFTDNELKQKDLRRSADLYAEIYGNDPELQELTTSALAGWPK
jgi:hypothetical protein